MEKYIKPELIYVDFATENVANTGVISGEEAETP